MRAAAAAAAATGHAEDAIDERMGRAVIGLNHEAAAATAAAAIAGGATRAVAAWGGAGESGSSDRELELRSGRQIDVAADRGAEAASVIVAGCAALGSISGDVVDAAHADRHRLD